MGWIVLQYRGVQEKKNLYCNTPLCIVNKRLLEWLNCIAIHLSVLQYTLVYCNEAGLKAVEDCIAIQLLYCNLGRLQ